MVVQTNHCSGNMAATWPDLFSWLRTQGPAGYQSQRHAARRMEHDDWLKGAVSHSLFTLRSGNSSINNFDMQHNNQHKPQHQPDAFWCTCCSWWQSAPTCMSTKYNSMHLSHAPVTLRVAPPLAAWRRRAFSLLLAPHPLTCVMLLRPLLQVFGRLLRGMQPVAAVGTAACQEARFQGHHRDLWHHLHL